MKIDSHVHFWKYQPTRDAWITEEMKIIQRDWLPQDLLPWLQHHHINGAVAVQADQSEEETNFLLALADQFDFIKGVVGWVDLRSAQVESRLSHFTSFKKIKGFRHIVQAEAEGFLLQPDFLRGIRLLRAFDFTYDILVYPKHLKAVREFVHRNPDQHFVIDHLAKPLIKSREMDTWKNDMVQLAAHEKVYCKVSGLVTEADWKNWKGQDFAPYLDVVFDLFGTKRILYGSDWPVCLVAATYQQQQSIVENYISNLSIQEKEDIMGGNAVRFYNL
jgi:L-fuconolactonase